MDKLTTLTVAELGKGYRNRDFSPVEVTEAFLERVEALNPQLHVYLTVTTELAREQARRSERVFADSASNRAHPLEGIPVAVKDAFYLAGYPTTLGSALFKDQMTKADSGLVRRLRSAGSVIIGKANTAEFGQSATSENMLGPDVVNPWNVAYTPGGSSGGSAAAVAARLAAVAVGSDGGGSVRIPAAFCGVFGLKTTPGLCPDEKGFRGMTDFVSAGPMSSTVADSRSLLEALSGRAYARSEVPRLKVAYSPAPEGWPVDPRISAAVKHVAEVLSGLGHEIIETDLPLGGWNEIFGPLVLEDEHRERGHLLDDHADQLTRYERSSLRAARSLDPEKVQEAMRQLPIYREKMADFFTRFDLALTPTTATPAFAFDQRPTEINGQPADRLWGPFPFTAQFNVAGVAAATVPCGLVDGMPVASQLVAAAGAEQLLLDLSESLEAALGFDVLAAARGLQLPVGQVA